MANPLALACDCGTVKTRTTKGYLVCSHCDAGACGGKCPLDRAYQVNVSRRLSDDK